MFLIQTIPKCLRVSLRFSNFGILSTINPNVVPDLYKIFMWAGSGTRKKNLDFGKDPDHILDPEFTGLHPRWMSVLYD